MTNKKNSTINNKSEFDNLKDVTIKEVKGFTVIENHNPKETPKIEYERFRKGDPNDTLPY